ncbi:MAG: hypothetical protein RL095_3782 [Verrucomicrobiota bacterium]|jgi:hypothetical protein
MNYQIKDGRGQLLTQPNGDREDKNFEIKW